MNGWLRNTPRVQWLWGHVTREVPVTHHARGHQVAISEAWMGTHLGVLSVGRAPCHSRKRRNLENSASIPMKEQHDRDFNMGSSPHSATTANPLPFLSSAKM